MKYAKSSFRDKKILLLLLLAALTAGCSSFSYDYPIGDFKALILSDIHIKNKPERDARLEKMVDLINNGKFPGVEFVVTTGDNATSYYDTYYPDSLGKSYNRAARFAEIMSKLKIPKYFVLGNHEYKIESGRDSDAPYDKAEIEKITRMWKRDTGFEQYYSFKHKGWKFVVLNSMSGRYMNRFFDDGQLKWFENELKDGLPTVLFFHHPIKTDSFRIWCKPSGLITVNVEPDFFKILNAHKNQIKGIFVGHGHRWVHDKVFGVIDVYETDSFGDNKSYPYYIVGFDNETQSIFVARKPIEITNGKAAEK